MASSKLTLLGLGFLFLFPVVMASLMYSGIIDYRPGSTVNRGELIQPPISAVLPEAFEERHLSGHWMLVYPLSLDCPNRCREDLAGLLRLQRALGRDAERVRNVVLAPEVSPEDLSRIVAEIDPGFAVISAGVDELRAQLDEAGAGAGTFVIDPLGNIMMKYEPGTNPDDIRHDLERLLKYGKTDQK